MENLKPQYRKLLLLPFLVLLFCSFSKGNASVTYSFEWSDPVKDSILLQQKDSLLFQLNLEYLNGVNEHLTPFELIAIIEKILELDPGQHNQWFNLGMENIKIREYQNAIKALQKGLDLYPQTDSPTLIQIYISLSFCYHKIEKHQKEKDILDKISELYPDHPGVTGRYVICAHSRMRYKEAEFHQERLTAKLKQEGLNAAEIPFYLGRLYLNTDYLEAEEHFRLAYHYDPDDVKKMGALAWVLIKNALRIDEGMALIEKAIKADPGNAIYIHQQGYGHYVKGNYKDALFNLYNARELYVDYSFDLQNHIQMVEEAIASLND